MNHGAEKLYRADQYEQHEQAGEDGRKSAYNCFHRITAGSRGQ
jgi:hypothetical protein